MFDILSIKIKTNIYIIIMIRITYLEIHKIHNIRINALRNT